MRELRSLGEGGEIIEVPPRVVFDMSFKTEGELPQLQGREHVRSVKTHPLVPQLPFLWNIVGPSGTGKTTMAVKTIIGPYLGAFDTILYFVPTFYTDPQWALIKAPKERVFTEWDEGMLVELHERLRSDAERRRNTGEALPSILIVLDDTAGLQASRGKKAIMDVIYASDRKHGVSVMNMTQRFRNFLSPQVRWNATHTSIFRLASRDEVEHVMTELCPPDITYKQFMTMYNQAVNAGLGSFFHISRFSPVGNRFSIGFNQLFAI
jgi:hypothetical protein